LEIVQNNQFAVGISNEISNDGFIVDSTIESAGYNTFTGKRNVAGYRARNSQCISITQNHTQFKLEDEFWEILHGLDLGHAKIVGAEVQLHHDWDDGKGRGMTARLLFDQETQASFAAKMLRSELKKMFPRKKAPTYVYFVNVTLSVNFASEKGQTRKDSRLVSKSWVKNVVLLREHFCAFREMYGKFRHFRRENKNRCCIKKNA